MPPRPPTLLPVVRILSKLGYCSRMQAVDLVRAGRVAVGGVVRTDPGYRSDFGESITVDGRPVGLSARRYIVVNKPRGLVTTRADEHGRDTVYRLTGLPEDWLAPVGRLDRDSEGLLLLTNDTQWAAWLTDPANAVPRVYEVTVRPGLDASAVDKLLGGVDIGHGEVSVPRAARLLASSVESATVELTLVEGRNREVRRIFRTLARRVVRLKRTSFGPFTLGTLAAGAWTEVDPAVARSAVWPGGVKPR